MADRQNDSTSRYTFLNALNMEQLEALLKTDYSGSMSEDASEEFINAIVEVMIKKEKEQPSGRFTDVDRAWADFQNYYNVPEREGQLLYPDSVPSYPTPSQIKRSHRPKRFLRRVSLVAAAILIFCITMVGAQASGIDVFGFLAQWTEDVFAYKPNSEYYPEIRDAFVQNHFPQELAAKWYPAGFVPAEPNVVKDEASIALHILFINDSANKRFSILVQRYSTLGELGELNHQLDPHSEEQYTSGGKTFFIVSNEGHTTATWSDQTAYTMAISGNLSVQETKNIIDSMGG